MTEAGLLQTDTINTGEGTLAENLKDVGLAAFESIFHKYKGRIYSLCYRLVNDLSEAEDLTQEVFLQLFRKMHTFRGESSFSTWFHRLAVNTVLMHLRKKKDIRQDALSEEDPALPANRAQPESNLNLDKIGLERAIAELPQGYRTILVLHDIEGYDHQEVAELLGCSLGTSKSQLHKARMRLREILRR